MNWEHGVLLGPSRASNRHMALRQLKCVAVHTQCDMTGWHWSWEKLRLEYTVVRTQRAGVKRVVRSSEFSVKFCVSD
jgi:hypothetical protein